MSYSFTKSHLNAILAGPSLDGFMSLAKFKKLTTPPANRCFRAYMRPRCPFRTYMRWRCKPYLSKYLDMHRRKKNPALVNPPINLTRLKLSLKSVLEAPSFQKPAGSPASRPGRFLIPSFSSFDEKSANPLTLKMQNKPKSQTAQIPLSPFTLRTKDDRLRTASQKNKPKQTQTCHPVSRHHRERIYAHAPP